MSAGTIGVEFSEPLSGSLSWWILKKPCDSAIRSTSPATRSSSFPRMAHPTSLPTTASSISTFESYCLAISNASGSSSFRPTLLTPKDDPERAGFTKTG
jgi:hypothetical protein